MIRTNLSTRPFYNERAVHGWVLALFIVVIAATVFNVTKIIQYSHTDTELASAASRDEARATELRSQAVKLRSTVDLKQIDAASADARLANNLIDRRTFSWTELFNQFETALPDDVRITMFREKLERGEIIINLTVVARNVDDVSKFMDNLEATGSFRSVGGRSEERVNEEGMLSASLEAKYFPMAAASNVPAERVKDEAKDDAKGDVKGAAR